MTSIVTAGTDFDDLTSGQLMRMRAWTGRAIEVTTKTGKTTSGLLLHVRAEGISIQRDAKTLMVDWSDVQSVALDLSKSEK